MSKTFDRFTSMAFLIIGALIMFQSNSLVNQNVSDTSVGPNVFPFGLGLILALLSMRQIYETFQYKNESKQKLSLDYKRFGIILVSVLLYVVFLENLGFVICTFAFLMIGFQTMEKGKWLQSILISFSFSYGLYYLFVNVLDGTLPGFPTWLGI